jgi:uncharacterized membrane protein YagU involved in acid resistance
MTSKIGAGAVAGVVAGVFFGIMMQMMTAPTPEGDRVPMMMMVAQVVRSKSLIVGWLFHFCVSAFIGASFALLFANRVRGYGSGTGWGAAYGLVWWVLGGLIAMPILLGMPAFAPLQMPPMRPVAMGSLVGHLIYGAILGSVYARLMTAGKAEARAGVA